MLNKSKGEISEKTIWIIEKFIKFTTNLRLIKYQSLKSSS